MPPWDCHSKEKQGGKEEGGREEGLVSEIEHEEAEAGKNQFSGFEKVSICMIEIIDTM